MPVLRAYKDPRFRVRIPIMGSSSVIQVDEQTIPSLEELLIILRRDKPQLNVFNDLALLYYRAGRYEEFAQLLETAKNDGFILPNTTYVGNDNDRGRTLDMLGSYYLLKYVRETDREQKKKYYKIAMMEFLTADNIVGLETTHLVARGMFIQLEGKKLDSAASQFEYVITSNPLNMMAVLGRAMYFLATNKVKEALGLFRQIMRHTKFNCSPDVRIGIGHCFLKLKQYDKALIAYERALELAPDNSTAKVGIATCLLSMKSKSNEEKKRAWQLAADVYKRNRDSYAVNTILADYYFYRHDYSSSESLCKHVIHNGTNENLRGEACFQMARLYHSKATIKEREIEQAVQQARAGGTPALDKAALSAMEKDKNSLYELTFQFYYQSTQLQKSDPRPFYGLGQMYLRKDDTAQAEKNLNHALELVPNDFDTMKMLGLVYLAANAPPTLPPSTGVIAPNKPREEKHMKAVEYLRKVAEGKLNDAEAWVQYAATLEGKDIRTALMSYAKATDLMNTAKTTPVPPAVYNNVACLHFSLGNFVESQRLFRLALTEIHTVLDQRGSSGGQTGTAFKHDTQHFRALSLLVSYNLARACEEVRDYERARQLYEQVLEQHRTNVHSILRLGIILKQGGHKVEAEQKFKDALEIEPNNPEPWIHLGNLHVKYSEYLPAQKKFERVLNSDGGREDVYCLCALGNIYLSTFSLHQHHLRVLQGPKKERLLRSALYAWKYFKAALQFDPKCFYAAHGLACLLAYRGFTHEAQRVFSQIRDDLVANDYADVIVNLAHIHVQLRQCEQALQLYDSLLRKFPDFTTDADFLVNIARAHYVAGDYEKARRVASRARMFSPTSEKIMYDLAVITRKGAKQVLVEPTNGLKRVTRAKAEIDTAKRYFRFLGLVRSNAGGGAEADLPAHQHASRAEKEAKRCDDLLVQTDHYLRKARENDEREAEIRRAHNELEQRLAAERAEVDARRIAEETRRKNEQDTRRLEMIVKANMIREGLKISQQQEEMGGDMAGGQSRKRKMPQDVDGFIDDHQSDSDMIPAGGGAERRAERMRVAGRRRGRSDQPDKKRKKTSSEARRKKVAARRRRQRQLDGYGAGSSDEDMGGKRSKHSSSRDKPGRRHKKRGGARRRRDTDSDDLAPGVSKAYVSTSEDSSSSEDETARQEKDARFKAKIAALAASTQGAVPGSSVDATASASGADKQPRKRATFLDTDDEDEEGGGGENDVGGKKRATSTSSSGSGSGSSASSSPDGSPSPQRRRRDHSGSAAEDAVVHKSHAAARDDDSRTEAAVVEGDAVDDEDSLPTTTPLKNLAIGENLGQ